MCDIEASPDARSRGEEFVARTLVLFSLPMSSNESCLQDTVVIERVKIVCKEQERSHCSVG